MSDVWKEEKYKKSKKKNKQTKPLNLRYHFSALLKANFFPHLDWKKNHLEFCDAVYIASISVFILPIFCCSPVSVLQFFQVLPVSFQMSLRTSIHQNVSCSSFIREHFALPDSRHSPYRILTSLTNNFHSPCFSTVYSFSSSKPPPIPSLGPFQDLTYCWKRNQMPGHLTPKKIFFNKEVLLG